MILYSTNCPKCKILESRLQKNKINFQISNDIDLLIEKGYQNAPVLQIGQNFYTYEMAMRLLKDYEDGTRDLKDLEWEKSK